MDKNHLVGRQIPMSSIAHKQCENSFTVFCTNLKAKIAITKSTASKAKKWPQLHGLLVLLRSFLCSLVSIKPWRSSYFGQQKLAHHTSSMFLFMHLGIDFYLYLFQDQIFVSQFLCTSQDLHKEH